MNTIRPLDRSEALLGALLLAVGSVSISGIVLAELGLLTRVWLTASVLALFPLSLWWSRRHIAPSGGRLAPVSVGTWLSLAGVVLLATGLFRPAMDAVFEGGDGSAYLAISRLLHEHGTLRPRDGTLESLPPELVEQLFRRDNVPPARTNFFPGALQISPAQRVELNFFHLFPIWMAVFTALFGPTAAAYVNPAFGTLAVALLWAAARRMAGTHWAGTAAGVLVAVNYGQVWFARFPTSEMLTQALVLGGLSALVTALTGGPRLAAALAGTCIGLAAFCRIDAMMLVAAPLIVVAAIASVRAGSSSRVWMLFCASALIVTVYAALHAFLFAAAYTQRALVFVFDPRWRIAAVGTPELVAAAVAAVAFLAVLFNVRGATRLLRAAAVISACVGAAWIMTTTSARIADSPLLDMMSRAQLALVLVAAAAVVARPDAEAAVAILVVLLTSLAVYLPSPREVAVMPTPLRRFVPVVLPTMTLLLVHAIFQFRRRIVWRVIATLVLVLIGADSVRLTRTLMSAAPYAGIRHEAARVAAAVPPRARVLVDRRAPSHLALALRYHFGLDVLIITGARAPDTMERLAMLTFERRQPVVVLRSAVAEDGGSLRGEEFRRLAVEPLAELSLHVPLFDEETKSLPISIGETTRTLELFSVQPRGRPVATLPLRIDIGPLDLASALSGFYPAERSGAATARWTNREAKIAVPQLALRDAVDGVLVVRAAVSRPPGVPLPALTFLFESEPFATLATGLPAFGEYVVPVPAATMARMAAGGALTIRSEVFVPAETGVSTDRRTLGIMIDWVELRQADTR